MIQNTSADAGLLRRIASMVYEAMLIVALWLVAGFAFVPVFGASSGMRRLAFQAYLAGVTGAYFVWFWTHGGQTLAMKTWNLRLCSLDGSRVGARSAIIRFIAALVTVPTGIFIVWALFDRQRRFLHDRIAGTRIERAL